MTFTGRAAVAASNASRGRTQPTTPVRSRWFGRRRRGRAQPPPAVDRYDTLGYWLAFDLVTTRRQQRRAAARAAWQTLLAVRDAHTQRVREIAPVLEAMAATITDAYRNLWAGLRPAVHQLGRYGQLLHEQEQREQREGWRQ